MFAQRAELIWGLTYNFALEMTTLSFDTIAQPKIVTRYFFFISFAVNQFLAKSASLHPMTECVAVNFRLKNIGALKLN